MSQTGQKIITITHITQYLKKQRQSEKETWSGNNV